MRFTILAAEWNAKLVALAKVMNSKVALPIYSTFLLELKDGVLRITASDMPMQYAPCHGYGQSQRAQWKFMCHSEFSA